MRQHRGELGFGLSEQDEAGVYADVSAGKREGIDRRIRNGEELEVER